jgi:hypothetical protein
MILFNLVYDGAPAPTSIKGTIGEAMGSNWPANPTRPGTVKGKDTDNDNWAFLGWAKYDTGLGDMYTSETVLPGSIRDNTVYAKWAPSTGWPPDVPPAGVDVAGAEKVSLADNWYPPYYFELPAGKTWSDYSGITFDFLFGPNAMEKGAGSRSIRLMGNYSKDYFSFVQHDAGVGNYPDGLMIAKFDDYNASCILNDLGQSNKTIAAALESLGMVPEVWKWFTISHKIDGSNKNGSYNMDNLPAADAAGPFIFGVGVPGGGDGGTTTFLRNVTLVGNTGTDNVIARPLYFSEGGKVYAAFCGYTVTSGASGSQEAYRGMVDGSQPVAVPK